MDSSYEAANYMPLTYNFSLQVQAWDQQFSWFQQLSKLTVDQMLLKYIPPTPLPPHTHLYSALARRFTIHLNLLWLISVRPDRIVSMYQDSSPLNNRISLFFSVTQE